MASIKVVLRKKKNKDGSYPLAIRITQDRKTSFIHLGHHLKDDDWNLKEQKVKKSHPNSARLNNYISHKLAEASNKVLELQTEKSDASARALKQRVKPTNGATFFKQGEAYLQILKDAGKYNRHSADKPRIERFKEFLKNEDIAFSDITVTMLERFKSYLKSTRSISERTAINHLIVIRSVFSQAIKDKVVDRKYWPFGKGQIIIKFPDSMKIGLTDAELKTLETIELENPVHNHARNVWLASFYFAGVRVSDTLRLRWSEIQNGRLYYKMGKNEKGDSLKVPEKAMAIFEQYRRPEPKHDLIFPDLEGLENIKDRYFTEMRIKTCLNVINDNLKEVAKLAKITKPLTMHISRHTFGQLSGDKIPIQMLQKLYRHSHISTTIGYQSNFIHKDADEALEAVIGS
jgi:integrase/recombinase XerD